MSYECDSELLIPFKVSALSDTFYDIMEKMQRVGKVKKVETKNNTRWRSKGRGRRERGTFFSFFFFFFCVPARSLGFTFFW